VACLDPSTELTKSADRTFVNPGETILYTITEKNTGNVDLAFPTIVDNVCDAGTLVGPTSGDDGDNILEVGETWTFTCTLRRPRV